MKTIAAERAIAVSRSRFRDSRVEGAGIPACLKFRDSS